MNEQEQAAPAFRTVPLEQVVESSANPRRHFDERGLAELTASVQEKGVLVPLLVRPVNGHYEIVAGARRRRAAAAAGLAEVPVLVRELTDDQALEAAVIENLQREDVHPLEEASGYRALMERARHDVESIAAKVGKSVSYVYQRLQLLKLIDPLQELFLEGEITAGHAVELARLTQPDQQQLLKDDRDWLFEHDGWGAKAKRAGPISVRALRQVIQRSFHLDLARAPWSLQDEDLIKNAGACTACPKRSGANPTLFPDIKDENTCTDRACYEIKQRRTAERKQAELVAKGQNVVLISDEHGYSGNDKKRLEAAGILERNDYGNKNEGWREAGKKKCPHLAKGIVADGHEIGTVKNVCTAPGKCNVHGTHYDERTSRTTSTEAWKKQQREHRIRSVARRRTLEAILAKVQAWANEDMRAVILQIFSRLYNPQDRDLVKVLGWLPEIGQKKGERPDHDKAFRQHLAEISDGTDLWRLAIRTMLWPDAQVGPYYGPQGGGRLEEFAKRYKVDAAAIERKVRDEEKAKEASKKKPVQTSAKAEKPAKAGKPKRGVCRVCGCTEDAPCDDGLDTCYWADPSETLCSVCARTADDKPAKGKTKSRSKASKKARAKK